MPIDATSTTAAPKRQVDPKPASGATVLVAGGDELFVELVTRGVRIADYAGRASRAVELSRVHEPDIVLIDTDGCDGEPLELVERICDAAPDAKVVVVAGSARPAEVERALEAGASGYLAKGPAAFAVLAGLLADAHPSGLRAV